MITSEIRHIYRAANPPLFSAKHLSQIAFGTFENALLFLRQVFAGTIDIEIQHRHR